jgi:hypothetical protein
MQSFQKVTPSQPHTGARVESQNVGRTWQTPEASPHVCFSQNEETPHSSFLVQALPLGFASPPPSE